MADPITQFIHSDAPLPPLPTFITWDSPPPLFVQPPAAPLPPLSQFQGAYLFPRAEGTDELITAVAAIDLGSGRFLHIGADGQVIYADAAAGRPAHGYTREAVEAGLPVQVRNEGPLNGLAGLTPGATYFLSDTTPGGLTLTPPAVGLVQPLGAALTADTLIVDIEPPVLAIG